MQISKGKKHHRKKKGLLKKKACYVEQRDEIKIRIFNMFFTKNSLCYPIRLWEITQTELKLHKYLEEEKKQYFCM